MVRIKSTAGTKCVEMIDGFMIFYMNWACSFDWIDDNGANSVPVDKESIDAIMVLNAFTDVVISDKAYDDIVKQLEPAIAKIDYQAKEK